MVSVFGRAASVILGLVVIASSPSSAVGQDGAPDSGASARECAAPLLDTTLFAGAFLEAVRSLSPAEAWAVGGRAIGRGAREALILRYDGIDWREEFLPMPLVGDSAFMSVDASGPRAHPWAVGYIRGPRSLAPLVARFADGGWVVDTALDAEEAGAVLVDVAATDDGAAWAVGFTLQEPGEQRPWAIRLTGEGFTAAPPPLGSDERGALSSVSATDEGDVWVVGTVTRGGTMVPYIARNAADGWVRQPLPDVGQGSLADISMPGPQQGWAVGHMLDGGSIRPLVLHWDGDSWAEAAAPETASSAMLLSGVSDPGVATVVGSEWDEQRQDFRGITARRVGSDWDVFTTPTGLRPSLMKAVDGDPDADGWIAGITGRGGGTMTHGLLTRTCEPIAEAQPSPQPEGTDAGPSAAASPPSEEATAEAGVTLAGKLGTTRAAEPEAWEIRDLASTLGLLSRSPTWGAVVADFDANGRDDIFLGRHGAQARLYLNHDGGFTNSDSRFGGGDRHGCAAADLDGSGLPDLYCTFGALRGTGIAGNQLWIDPGGPDPQLHPSAGGALEPFGRGRRAAFMDIDDDGFPDLLLAQEANRIDSMVSAARAYVGTGPATLEARVLPGFDPGLNIEVLETGDVDADGRDDLLVVYADRRAASPRSGVRLYRNLEGLAFEDVTADYAIGSIADDEAGIYDVDAELVDLDGDGRLDLVQLSGDRLLVSLQRDGRFVPAYEVAFSTAASATDGAIAEDAGPDEPSEYVEVAGDGVGDEVEEDLPPGAVAIAHGDVDADGDEDLYVLMKEFDDRGGDVVFINAGDGSTFSTLVVPGTAGAGADDVLPIDHDADGASEFLVLNGRGVAGPVQLISVRPASPS